MPDFYGLILDQAVGAVKLAVYSDDDFLALRSRCERDHQDRPRPIKIKRTNKAISAF